MNISDTVDKLIAKHETSNPIILAKELNTIVLMEPLGHYKGYYNKCYRQKFIHINEDLSDREKEIVCAHELGHSVLHTDTSTPFMRSNTFYCVSKLERQANQFAAQLLISDEFLRENKDLDLFRLAGALDLPVELVKIRLNIF